MTLGTRPSAQAADHLVHFHNNGPDIAEIRLDAASAQVRRQSFLKFGFMGNDGSLEFFELPDPPFNGKGLPGAEVFTLRIDDGADLIFCKDILLEDVVVHGYNYFRHEDTHFFAESSH